MNKLDKLENQSIFIIRESYYKFKNLAVLWSIGKDSTTLMWLIQKAFFGKIPVDVLHIDTGYKFKEIYEFRNKYAQEWGLNLVITKNVQIIENNKLSCCNHLKTNALKNIINKNKYDALLLGIRRDEHGIRAKERVFSPRNENFEWDYTNQPPEIWGQYTSKQNDEQHTRIHPLLHWTELDIWEYIQRENIPIVNLYLSKNGKRYRSIGCEPCCFPIYSDADSIDKIVEELKITKISERSGRAQDKEAPYVMQKLRALGYM